MTSTHAQQLDPSDIEQCPKLDSYQPLDPAHREIRLIRLSEDIDIQKFALHDAPQYHAISYHWGPPTPTRFVKVQNQLVEVRESVTGIFEALRNRYGADAWYWIDIFCINQHDLAERNGQVSIMTEIFKHAVRVLTWLGTSTPQSHTAFRLVEKAVHCPKDAPPRLVSDEDIHINNQVWAEDQWPSTEDMSSNHELYGRFAESVVWPAFSDILRRAYWSRMWVVQEIIVAKKSIILCGSDCTDLDRLVEIGSLWMRKSQYYQHRPDSAELEVFEVTAHQHVINTWVPLEKLVQYREQYHGRKILLMELVDSYAVKNCSNVLDKVYALRALSSEAGTVPVDYARSVPEVFLSLVASGLLLSDGGRGFQSLPYLARCMGLNQQKLHEILLPFDEVLIPIDAIPLGAIISLSSLSTEEPNQNDENSSLRKYESIEITSNDSDEAVLSKFLSNYPSRLRQFWNTAQAGDTLCIVPTKQPILILLRAQEGEKTRVFQALANLHSWGVDPPDEPSETVPNVGRITVEGSEAFKLSEKHQIMISSRSITGLLLWTETRDKRYVFMNSYSEAQVRVRHE